MKASHIVLYLAALTASTTCLLVRKYIFVSTPMTWTMAQDYCRKYYVDLSTIDSSSELDNFRNDVTAALLSPTWIGLTKEPDQKVFSQWSDGTGFGFSSWTSHQPDNLDTDHCVFITSGKFSNTVCSNLLPFSCYTLKPTLIMVQEMKTWPEALIHCRANYTDLISLSTETDFIGVNKIIMNFQNVSAWTGLNFLNDLWFWVNMEPLKNTSLLPSCPKRPLLCGANVGFNLQNRDCMEKMNFICYQKVSDGA